MTYAIMLGVFVILLFLGAPIALSLGMSSLLAILYNGTGINVIAGQIYGGIGKYLLLAVPFFVLSGNIMAKAGISDRLIAFIDALLGHLRGGIAMVCVVVACFFGAISGSGAATVAALGVILIPAMIEREKFSDPFAHGVVAAASSIAVIIPPSISFVIYASLTGVSVGDIFVAGILPGVIMGVAMIIVVQIYAHKHHLKPAHPWKGWREVWRTFKSAFWGLLMPVIILGGIYSGLFTPTEAAAIAVFYGIIVSAFVYRNMGMKDFLHVLSASASSTASILFLVANAHIFSYLLSSEQIPQKLAILMTSLTTNPTMIMFLIMIVLLIAGCFLDNAVAVILLTPIFVNVVQAMNIDICYFGVFLVFVLAIGQVTPPVGLCLFVACDIGKVSIEKISREVLPYVGGLIVTAILLVLFPRIVTWLPSLTKMA